MIFLLLFCCTLSLFLHTMSLFTHYQFSIPVMLGIFFLTFFALKTTWTCFATLWIASSSTLWVKPDKSVPHLKQNLALKEHQKISVSISSDQVKGILLHVLNLELCPQGFLCSAHVLQVFKTVPNFWFYLLKWKQ